MKLFRRHVCDNDTYLRRIQNSTVIEADMGIYRDNLSAIAIGDKFLPIIVIAQMVLIYRLPISLLL